MAGQRIKGQEVEILLVADGEVQDQLTDVQSFEFTQETTTLEEGYLGETSNRFDEIYNGYSCSIGLHSSSPSVLDFMQTVKSRAQRRTPGVIINIKATLNYPNGERRRVILNDVFFDPMGLNFAARDQYGTTTLNGKGSEWRNL